MTTEELRQRNLRGIDGILDAPRFVQRFLTDQDRRLIRATRSYWQGASEAELQRLMALLEKEPLTVRETAEPYPCLGRCLLCDSERVLVVASACPTCDRVRGGDR